MWQLIVSRLDRPWKRIAFVFWAPLFLVTVGVAAYTSFLFYIVHVESNVFLCHRDLAGFDYRLESSKRLTDADLNDQQKVNEFFGVGGPNEAAIRIAHQRSNSRFSADTLAAEATPKFQACMSRDRNYGRYWQDYPLVLLDLRTLASLTLLIALIIFPRFWRSLGNWIAMRS